MSVLLAILDIKCDHSFSYLDEKEHVLTKINDLAACFVSLQNGKYFKTGWSVNISASAVMLYQFTYTFILSFSFH